MVSRAMATSPRRAATPATRAATHATIAVYTYHGTLTIAIVKVAMLTCAAMHDMIAVYTLSAMHLVRG